MEIDNWEYELKTQCFSFDEINEQFNSLVKDVNILAKEAILANVDLTVCGQISECKTTVQQLKRNALFDLEMRESMDSHHQDSRMEDRLRDEIYLSFRVRSLIMLVNDLSSLFQLILMMIAWVGVRLLITLVKDLPSQSQVVIMR